MSDLRILSIDQLQANPFQPRDKVKTEDIQELAKSIKTYGVLEPLVVAETPAGFQIIAGERRWRASKLAGLTEVPVHIKKTTPKGMLEMAIVENVQRSNLSALERAQAFQRLAQEFSLTNEQIGERVGKSPSYVSNTMRLLRLPDAIKDALSDGEISEGHARVLVSFDDEKLAMKVFRQIVKEKASVRRAEELVRHYKNQENVAKEEKTEEAENIDYDKVEKVRESLQRRIHSPGQIKLSRSNRQTRIIITLRGDQAKTQSDMDRIMEIIGEN
jgi:ParB family transcriptional regulator, chromosome partitioning protein